MTAENLGKLGVGTSINALNDDAMSEFSHLTTESDILPQENVLDLRVADVQFDPAQINQVLGMTDALPNAIKTFVTLDFFNHDTRHTDMTTGYEPQFDTIFSFKNAVDDFYLRYLSKESIIAEVFTIKGAGKRITEKIGEAKLPLSVLLEGDTSF